MLNMLKLTTPNSQLKNTNCFSTIKKAPRLPRAHPSLTRPNNSPMRFYAKIEVRIARHESVVASFSRFCAANHRPLISLITPKTARITPATAIFF